MSWIDYEYPNTAYIVEVEYTGDIAITTCRCNEMPKNKDNSYGFTQGFWDYNEAIRYAKHTANELEIPSCI